MPVHRRGDVDEEQPMREDLVVVRPTIAEISKRRRAKPSCLPVLRRTVVVIPKPLQRLAICGFTAHYKLHIVARRRAFLTNRLETTKNDTSPPNTSVAIIMENITSTTVKPCLCTRLTMSGSFQAGPCRQKSSECQKAACGAQPVPIQGRPRCNEARQNPRPVESSPTA